MLAPTKQAVLDEAARIEGLDFDPDPLLRRASRQRFYNTSELNLEKVAGDASNVAAGLRAYMAAFSPTVREIFGRTCSRDASGGRRETPRSSAMARTTASAERFPWSMYS